MPPPPPSIPRPKDAPRKGARTIAAIPRDVLQRLNRGEIETRTLVEWYAIDQRCLLQHVLPDLGLPVAADTALLATAEDLATAPFTARLNRIALGLGEAIRVRADEPAIFHRLATHPSDIVRIWACLALRHDSRPAPATRLRRTRPFAADRNISVREFAIDVFRPLLITDLGSTLDLLLPWVHDADPNIRRCAVEGSRPRGVWTAHIPLLKQDPDPALPLLEPVRADPSRYVQNAVANWINDAGHTNPDWALTLCRRWQTESPTPATAYIVKRGLRTLRRRGLAL